MNKPIVKIANVRIGDRSLPPFIAEIGVNHLGNFERMITMIDQALKGGANLIKFQTYKAEDRYDTTKNPKASQFIELTKKWQFSKSQEKESWDYARKKNAKVFTSVYDLSSVDFAYDLGTLAYKIASFEITNYKLIRCVAEKKLPVIISCGMTNNNEIEKCLNILDKNSCKYILLHCVSAYPLEKEYSFLARINELKKQFSCPIGHSDHTRGTEMIPYSVAAGSNIIEKHFTDNIRYRESDNFFSITYEELVELKYLIKKTHKLMYNFNNEVENFMRNFKK